MPGYKYKLLSQEEQDEILADFLEAQERDLYCLELNEQRFEEMLRTLPEGPWKERIRQLYEETKTRKAEVESIIKATEKQLPPEERLIAAKSRLAAKRGIGRG